MVSFPRLLIVLLALWGTGVIDGGPRANGVPASSIQRVGTDANVSGSSAWKDYLTGKRPLRVGLVSGANEIQLTCDMPFRVTQGETAKDCRAGDVFTASDVIRQPVRLVPDKGATWTVRVNGKPWQGRYTGPMEIFTAPNATDDKQRLTLANEPPFEQYIAGVVAKEVGSNFKIEALRAQAIAARSYTLRYLGCHQAEGFDLCANQHCQMYQGGADRLSRVYTAVYSTRGQVLVYKGRPIKAVYSSTCGGETASGEMLDIDAKECPYLVGCSDEPSGVRPTTGEPTPQSRLSGEDAIAAALGKHSTAYCSIAREGVYRWQKTLTAAEVDRFVGANLAGLLAQPGLKPGRVKSMRVSNRSGGRAQTLELACENSIYEVTGNDIRWLFGKGKPDGLKSTFFTLSMNTDAQGNPQTYTFTGGGWGHGVGMCQNGAEGRARAGQTADEILAAYYPGTKLWRADLTDESEARD